MRKNFRNIDIFAAQGGASVAAAPECADFDTAEQIKVKQVYTSADIEEM